VETIAPPEHDRWSRSARRARPLELDLSRRATQLRALANTRADAGLERLSLIAHDASEDPSVRQVAALALEAIAGSQTPDHVIHAE